MFSFKLMRCGKLLGVLCDEGGGQRDDPQRFRRKSPKKKAFL